MMDWIIFNTHITKNKLWKIEPVEAEGGFVAYECVLHRRDNKNSQWKIHNAYLAIEDAKAEVERQEAFVSY